MATDVFKTFFTINTARDLFYMARKRKVFGDDLLDDLSELDGLMGELFHNLPLGELDEFDEAPSVQGFFFKISGKSHAGFEGESNGESKWTPLVDVLNGAKEVTVITEMPGVDEDAVSLSFNDRMLAVKVLDKKRAFSKKIKLPVLVSRKGARASLKNGILEVVLKKKK